MRRLVAAALIAGTVIAGAAAQKAPAPLVVKVYVDFTPPKVSPEGFVDESDKWLVDSRRDIQAALDSKDFHPNKGFPGSPEHYVLAADKEKADIVVTVAARGVSTESLGQRTTMQIYRGVVLADTVPTIGVTRWVSIVLSVGTYRKEFVAWSTNRSRFSAGAWTADANLLAKVVAGWVMANEEKIRELQKAKSPRE